MTRKADHRKLLDGARKDGTYERLLKLQGGACGICRRLPEECCVQPNGTIRKFDIDHDHKTMKIRGLLCRGCNMRLRKDHKPGWLAAASEYLLRCQD